MGIQPYLEQGFFHFLWHDFRPHPTKRDNSLRLPSSPFHPPTRTFMHCTRRDKVLDSLLRGSIQNSGIRNRRSQHVVHHAASWGYTGNVCPTVDFGSLSWHARFHVSPSSSAIGCWARQLLSLYLNIWHSSVIPNNQTQLLETSCHFPRHPSTLRRKDAYFAAVALVTIRIGFFRCRYPKKTSLSRRK